MNEYGLAVGMMAVSRAEPHYDPDRPTISSLEAIRLMLDFAKDVEEAVTLLGQYNIDFIGGPPLHYLIADSLGNSVVVEFINGEMILLEREDPWQVSTNFLISIEEPVESTSSCWRYNTAFDALQESQGNITADEGMAILETVAQSNTIWSILYNQSTGEISLSVGRDFQDPHSFTLENFQ
jgi:choloylglycine hydrolase